jgi:hypothetical protein
MAGRRLVSSTDLDQHRLFALAGKELERTRWQPEFRRLAEMYMNRFTRCRDMFVKNYDHNLLNGFRRFFDAVLAQCQQAGLAPYLAVLCRDRPAASVFKPAFYKRFWALYLDRIYQADPVLSSFLLRLRRAHTSCVCWPITLL